MKKRAENKAEKILSKIAYRTAKQQVNSVCNVWFYQPEIPKKVKELRKF